MAFYDTDILIRNIKKLMDDNNITQSALAGILGMSQSNVSKALSKNDKKSFTLDQLAGIAKHFKVSIDKLIGNERSQSQIISPQEIASYFTQLIEHEDITVFEYPVEEMVYEPCYDNNHEITYNCSAQTVRYNAFYFPSYWHMPSGLSREEESELWAEMTQCGNLSKHFSTNRFIHQFLQVHTLYKQKALEEDTYRTVVADLLNHLPE